MSESLLHSISGSNLQSTPQQHMSAIALHIKRLALDIVSRISELHTDISHCLENSSDM